VAFRWCDGNVKPNAEHLACESVVNDAGSSHTIAGHAPPAAASVAQDRVDHLAARLGAVVLPAIRTAKFLFFCDLGNVLIGSGLRMGLSTRLSGDRAAVGLFPHPSVSRLADAALAALAPASSPAVPRASGAAAAALSVYFGGLPGCFRTADSGCGYSIDPLKDEMSSSWKSGKGNCLPSRSSAIFLTALSAFSSWTPVSRLR
jgi:hypothetical protein